jgi:hypothetical protein
MRGQQQQQQQQPLSSSSSSLVWLGSRDRCQRMQQLLQLLWAWQCQVW